MSNKLVPLNILPQYRLPHVIEGVDVQATDQLVDLETKQRLMSLRPNLFSPSDPDWPVKVERVELVGEETGAAEETTKKGGKKSGGDNPA